MVPAHKSGLWFATQLNKTSVGFHQVFVQFANGVGMVAQFFVDIVDMFLKLLALFCAFAAFRAAFGATLAIAIWILARGQVGHCLDVKREAGQWFVFAAILVGASQLFRYMALALAPVAVVQPIQRLSGIFRVVFSTLLNREHEVLDNTVISATVVSIIGALLLSLSVDSVIATLPLPNWLAAVLRWHWP